MPADSLDLRRRVVPADENGVKTVSEVAECSAVSGSLIENSSRRQRAAGQIASVGFIAAGSRNAWVSSIGSGN